MRREAWLAAALAVMLAAVPLAHAQSGGSAGPEDEPPGAAQEQQNPAGEASDPDEVEEETGPVGESVEPGEGPRSEVRDRRATGAREGRDLRSDRRGRGAGWARGGRGHHRDGARNSWRRIERALARLDLTDVQRGRLTAIQDRQQRRTIQARAEIQTARLDLRRLLRDRDPDRRAIDGKIDEIAGLRANLQKSRIAALLETRSLLTDEQRRRLGGRLPMLGAGGSSDEGMERVRRPFEDRGEDREDRDDEDEESDAAR